MNTAAFITRLHYPRNHPDWQWRLKYYSDRVLPSILNQTDQDFDIWVWCEPHHVSEVKGLHRRIRTFWAPYQAKGEKYLADQVQYDQTVGLPKYKLQIGIDSDDFISKKLLQKARSICKGEQSTVVSFQPVLFDVKTKRCFYMKRRYGPNFGSAVFAFYQPNLDNYQFAYTVGHRSLPKLAEKVVVVPEGYAFVSIHDRNYSTRLHKNARPYKRALP